jgi:phosphoenolpyruvate carboxykinase (GTP)
MAMLPFCGYNMADYFSHWLSMGDKSKADRLPKIFFVNWFRRDEDGRFLWPGYGENSRVLKWVFDRIDGKAGAKRTEIGWLPGPGDIDTSGLKVDQGDMETILSVDTEGWRSALPQIEQHYAQFGGKLPARLGTKLKELAGALG